MCQARAKPIKQARASSEFQCVARPSPGTHEVAYYLVRPKAKRNSLTAIDLMTTRSAGCSYTRNGT